MTFKSPHEPGSELWCEALSHYINEAVAHDTIAEYREPEPGRWHLGASEIGQPCSRRIWYSFRWALKQEFTPAMHRLFQRGHNEENRFVHRLKRIGITAWDRDPNTGEQFRMEHPNCPHYGGSLDGIAYVPWAPEPFRYMNAEFKTHNDASFNKLKKNGLRMSKPVHYAQMSSYGEAKKLPLGLYCAVNKNNDELEHRVVPLSWNLGEITTRKAMDIINRQVPPLRYSENPTAFECKFCPYKGPCHLNQPLLKNCRSCSNARPNPNDKEWTCAIYGGPIPRVTVIAGCDKWSPIA